MKKKIFLGMSILFSFILLGCNSTDNNNSIFGTYVFDSPVYISSLSSSSKDIVIKTNKEASYTIEKKNFEVNLADSKFIVSNPQYKKVAMNDDQVKDFNIAVFNAVNISDYKNRCQYIIYDENNQKVEYYLYTMDNELWLALYFHTSATDKDMIFNIFKLKKKSI